MKQILTIMGVFGLILVQAQVGINQDVPKATLDINAGKTDGSQVEGLLIPRISKEAAYNMATATPQPQESNLVYVDNLSATFTAPTGDTTVTDITEKGYYFWSDNNKWVKVKTFENSIWKKIANGVELNNPNLKDSIQYTENGYWTFDKSKMITNYFDIGDFTYKNSSIDSINAYTYQRGFYKNIQKKSDDNVSVKRVDAIATSDYMSNYGLNALYATSSVDGQNPNSYANMSGVNAGSFHHGSGRVGWVRGATFTGFVSKHSRAQKTVGLMSGAYSYSDLPVVEVIGSESIGVVRGTGNVKTLIGHNVLAGGGKSNVNNPNVTATIDNLYGGRYTIGSKLGIAGNIGGLTGLVKNAYGNLIDYKFDNTTPINNVYGLYIKNLPAHATGNKYAIYTSSGKISLGDTLRVRNIAWTSNQEAVFEFSNGSEKINADVATTQIIDQMNGSGDGGSNLVFRTQSPTPGTNPNLTAPTEKMRIGADGEVTVNNLSGIGDRMVVADATGVLKTTTTTAAQATSKWSNDATNNTIKLAKLADGTTVRADSANLFVKDNGNIGIGASNPISKLEIAHEGYEALGLVNKNHIASENQIQSALRFSDKNKKWYGYIGDGTSSTNIMGLVGRNSHRLLLMHANVNDGTYPDIITNYNSISLELDERRTNAKALFLSVDRTNYPSKTYKYMMKIDANGNVGIGQSPTTVTTEKLEVNGNVKATTFIATASGSVFPDYVFEKYYTGESSLKSEYDFKTLSEVEAFVKEKGHLPGYLSAKEVSKTGSFDMTATQLINVEKIEELYLHTIEQGKEMELQKKQIEEKDAKIKELEAQFKSQETRIERLEKLLQSK